MGVALALGMGWGAQLDWVTPWWHQQGGMGQPEVAVASVWGWSSS